MTITKIDSNYKWQFNVEEGWLATIPRNNWEHIPEEDFRVYVGEHIAAGTVTKELIQRLCDSI